MRIKLVPNTSCEGSPWKNRRKKRILLNWILYKQGGKMQTEDNYGLSRENHKLLKECGATWNKSGKVYNRLLLPLQLCQAYWQLDQSQISIFDNIRFTFQRLKSRNTIGRCRVNQQMKRNKSEVMHTMQSCPSFHQRSFTVCTLHTAAHSYRPCVYNVELSYQSTSFYCSLLRIESAEKCSTCISLHSK